MLRFGLCCLFDREPIRFRAATASRLSALDRPEQLRRLSDVCRDNTRRLLQAVETAHRLGIGAFRVSSPLFPRFTHPEVGYAIDDLPDAAEIVRNLAAVKSLAERCRIRLSFHPDQFVVLSSPDPAVVEKSGAELEYQGLLAAGVGADTITLHGGGFYGDKAAALSRLRQSFATLSDTVRRRLALENDDRVYTVRDLLPVCADLSVPLVYDVHHHRCNPDGLGEEEATGLALRTWEKCGREPYFHISSPKNGWSGGPPGPHADYVDAADFPPCWLPLTATVDVEAKAKELAVLRLMRDLGLLKQTSEVTPRST